MPVSRLGTAPASTSYDQELVLPRPHLFARRPRITSEVVVEFQDWTIDGVPLTSMLGEQQVAEFTRLSHGSAEDAVPALRRLTGELPGDLRDGRVTLLTCPECRSLECDPLTCELVIDDDVVRWLDLGWQEDVSGEVELIGGKRSFVFDREQYFSVLWPLLESYTLLAGQPDTDNS